jgi:hypothetical protein
MAKKQPGAYPGGELLAMIQLRNYVPLAGSSLKTGLYPIFISFLLSFQKEGGSGVFRRWLRQPGIPRTPIY